jgi:hypothetical protein
MSRRLPIRHGLRITFTAVACLIAISLIAFSPVALTRLEGLSKEWGKLSNIGQAYGAISALISSLALAGVIVSLLYQARAGHTAREQSMRTLQQELIRMEMADPTLMTAMGAPWGLPIAAESAKIREHLYIHMWTTFWAGNYVVGELTAPAVRKLVRSELFNSRAGRTYWAAIRGNVLSTNEGKYRHFALIVDEVYRKVIANNTPVADPVRVTDHIDNSVPPPKKELKQFALVGAALITGALAWRRFSQQARRVR